MTWRPGEPSDETYLPIGTRYIRENWQCIQNVLGADFLNENKQIEIFPVGTNLWFYQDVAPLGWSTITTIGDSLLATKGDGTSAYTTGGTEQGTWQLPDHVLSIDEMPYHNHYISPMSQVGGVRGGDGSVVAYATGFPPGSAGPYNVSGSGNNQPHNHGNAWRPQASVGIICTKDPM